MVRIGIDVGEPVADSNDLFGATVQTAARLCQSAEPGAIWVSGAVRDALNARLKVKELGARSMKGFPSPVAVYEVECR
jgi:class 3 adenylate cyclase